MTALTPRRVAARIFHREMHRRLVAARLDRNDLHFLESLQRFVHARRVVEDILSPQPRMQARLLRIARPEIGSIEIQQMNAEALLVYAIDRAEPVHRRDEAAVFRRPLRGILLHHAFRTSPNETAVMLAAARENREFRLGALGPVHRAADKHRKLVVVPQDARAGVGRLNECGQRERADNGCRQKMTLQHHASPASASQAEVNRNRSLQLEKA